MKIFPPKFFTAQFVQAAQVGFAGAAVHHAMHAL
jgi:hypothetical protein